jgi:glycosyltransferase involved in cell wall biosynthesis
MNPMKNDVLVSTIIPVFNGARYISQAIGSVLNQTFTQVEVIVVDDGSTDDTQQQVLGINDPRVCLLSQVHAGASAARNYGVQNAHGQYLSFLDSDDLWEPHKLAAQLGYIANNPHVDMVFGHYIEFVSPELSAPEISLSDTESSPAYSSGTMLIKRTAFDRVGEFSTQWQLGEFIDWYARAIDLGLYGVMLPELFLRRRIHHENIGVREQGSRNQYAQVIAAIIKRRRAQE